jgi:3-hydroxyisobutyrate dehydrogenase-like beta-hydroxyacid dehydrogenase
VNPPGAWNASPTSSSIAATSAPGHKVKLVNNMLSLGYGMVTAEALLAAKKGGIDLKALREVSAAAAPTA